MTIRHFVRAELQQLRPFKHYDSIATKRKPPNSSKWAYFLVSMKLMLIILLITYLAESATPILRSTRAVLILFLGWTALAMLVWMVARRFVDKQ